jgi:hypothetical protein
VGRCIALAFLIELVGLERPGEAGRRADSQRSAVLSLVIAALIVAAAIGAAAFVIATEVRAGARRCDADQGTHDPAGCLRPGIEAARADPRALLVWHPLGRAVRQPVSHRARGARQGRRRIVPLHARPGAGGALAVDDRLAGVGASARRRLQGPRGGGRTRTGGLERIAGRAGAGRRHRREKLDLYQRRYQDYVQVARALQALIDNAAT